MPRPVSKTMALTAVLVIAAPAVQATGFGDMFNPGRWFGGDDNDRYYDEGPWGPYGPGAYGVPGYGPYGGYGYGPYGAPGYGHQAPAYGAPGYGAPPSQTAPAQPTPGAGSGSGSGSGSDSGENAKDREIEALKRRIEQLESRNAPQGRPQPPEGRRGGDNEEGWPPAPAFRPMDQY
ncbi:MAG: hypothetical protein ACOCWF_07230 [Halochromatium sp.]